MDARDSNNVAAMNYLHRSGGSIKDMDSRRTALSRAAYAKAYTSRWKDWDNLCAAVKNQYANMAEATVNEAYRIDGVRELVEAAEAMSQELRNIANANPGEWGLNKEEVGPEFEMWAKSRCTYTLDLHGAAAARVREAMGGGA